MSNKLRDRSLEILTAEFCSLDDEVSSYIGGILETPEDIATEEEIFDAVGELLMGIAPDKSELEVRKILRRILKLLHKNSDSNLSEGKFTLLNAPINLRDQIIESNDIENNVNILDSDWSIVDKQKLEKAESKTKQKQAKRELEELEKLKEVKPLPGADSRPTLNQVSLACPWLIRYFLTQTQSKPLFCTTKCRERSKNEQKYITIIEFSWLSKQNPVSTL